MTDNIQYWLEEGLLFTLRRNQVAMLELGKEYRADTPITWVTGDISTLVLDLSGRDDITSSESYLADDGNGVKYWFLVQLDDHTPGAGEHPYGTAPFSSPLPSL